MRPMVHPEPQNQGHSHFYPMDASSCFPLLVMSSQTELCSALTFLSMILHNRNATLVQGDILTILSRVRTLYNVSSKMYDAPWRSLILLNQHF